MAVIASITNANAFQITLNFYDKQDASEWFAWYVDGSGEQISGFIAEDWLIGQKHISMNLICENRRYDEKSRKIMERCGFPFRPTESMSK